jgi:8-oxoguanine deaminase
MRTFIKDPIAVLAEGAGARVVIEDGRIAGLSGAGSGSAKRRPRLDASRHVVIPGLINTHHHFFQTLTRAHPAAINKELFPG